jgi:membrane-associated phospholipid phosphatase
MKSTEIQPLKRSGFLLTLIALQLLYFPINQSVTGGVSTLLPIDDYIPLAPIWAVPYLLSIVWWGISVTWATYRVEVRFFVQFFICLLLTVLISYVIYLLFPTYVDRPKVTDEDVFTKMILFIYGNDRPYNVLPSNHTYTSLIIAIFWSRWFPKQRILWMSAAIIVILSTLFTKQHAVLDVIASVILVLICYPLSAYLTRNTAG